LAQLIPWFDARGLKIVAVTLGKAYEAKMFCAQRSPDLVCLSNPDQSAYQAYRIGRAGLRELLDPAVTLGGLRAATQGYLPKVTETDMLQMSATLVIDAEGVLHFAHYNKHLADQPDLEVLKQTVEALLIR
jgi:peroxiredoxin